MRAEVFRVGDGDHVVPGVRRRFPPPPDRVRCPRRISAADYDHNLQDGVAGHITVVQLAGHLVPATDTPLITFPSLPFI